MKTKPETWWSARNPSGLVVWSFLQYRKADVIEVMNKTVHDWRRHGWTIVKLTVHVSP